MQRVAGQYFQAYRSNMSQKVNMRKEMIYKTTPKKMQRMGFTIVELLIVIVILAILAAISVVAYTGIQQRARDSAVQAEATGAKKKLEIYKATNGQYPDSSSLAAAGVVDANGVTYQYLGGATAFCLTATIANTSFKITEQTSAQKGGCAGHGQGGVVPIRNLALDPKATGTNWLSPIVAGVSRTMNVTWSGKSNWSRFVWNGSGATTVRMYLNLADLVGGEVYTISFLAGNSGTSPVSFTMDMADAATSPVFTLAPGEQRRVTFASSKDFYSTVYRFIDMNLQTSGGSGVLMSDAMVTRGSEVYQFAHGDSADWRWEGAANNSVSVGPPL